MSKNQPVKWRRDSNAIGLWASTVDEWSLCLSSDVHHVTPLFTNNDTWLLDYRCRLYNVFKQGRNNREGERGQLSPSNDGRYVGANSWLALEARLDKTSGNGPSEQNTVRTKANFVLLGNSIWFLWKIVLTWNSFWREFTCGAYCVGCVWGAPCHRLCSPKFRWNDPPPYLTFSYNAFKYIRKWHECLEYLVNIDHFCTFQFYSHCSRKWKLTDAYYSHAVKHIIII